MFHFIQQRDKHPEIWRQMLKEAGYVQTGLNMHWLIGKAPDLMALVHLVPTEHYWTDGSTTVEIDPWIPEWMLAVHIACSSYEVEIVQCRRVQFDLSLRNSVVEAARNGHGFIRKHDYEGVLKVKQLLGLPMPEPVPEFDND